MDNPHQEFKKTKQKVEEILEQYPEAREGDPTMTILYVWRDFDGLPDWIVENLLSYKEKHETTNFETIRRMRQKLQNQERTDLGACEATQQQRADAAQDFKENINR
jgi:K+ transporter